MNIRKTISVLNFLARALSQVTKLKAVKLLYYIDKKHFLENGRFVIEDHYFKWQYGPVPISVLSLIDNPSGLPEEDQEYLNRNIAIKQTKFRTMTSKKEPDMDEFSQSEIETIKKVIKKYGHMETSKLVDLSHEEKAWKNAAYFDKLKISDMVSSLAPEAQKELMAIYQEDRATQAALCS
jgi:uncharacterized phage-associated protein